MANKESVAYLSDLDAKLDGLAKVARTGSYNDLKDQPAPLSPGQQAALDSGITPEKVRKLDDLPGRAELGTELGKKRDLTDLSVDQDKWLIVKPDGTQVWLEKPDPQRDEWVGDGFTLDYDDTVESSWALVKTDAGGVVVDDSAALPPDTNRLEFVGSDGTSVYRLVRGSRIALDTEVSVKADAVDVPDDVVLDGNYMRFKHGNAVLFSMDVSTFVKDGMVDDVRIQGGNLVITFNSDAGKQGITIPLADIFDPSNYYNKSEVDGLVDAKANSDAIADEFSENIDYFVGDSVMYNGMRFYCINNHSAGPFVRADFTPENVEEVFEDVYGILDEKSDKRLAAPLIFEARQAGSTVALTKVGSFESSFAVRYSTDGTSWSNYRIGDDVVTLSSVGDFVMFAAPEGEEYDTVSPNMSGSNYYQFVMTGKIGVSGDLTSLLGRMADPERNLAARCFNSLFYNCTALESAPELPATRLGARCYQSLFSGCTSLVHGPFLPAKALAASCYANMFLNCSSLSSVVAAFTSFKPSSATNGWLTGVSSTGVFKCDDSLYIGPRGASTVPQGWTIDNGPTIPIAPSTDPSAQGKPADAKDTGDALAGKYAKPSGGIPATDLAQSVQSALDSIPDKANNDLVPEGTNSSTNMLVNQQGLNDAIQTYSAHYRGYFQTWYDVPDDPLLYAADSEGNHEPGPNDYIAVGDMSDYPYGDDSSDSSDSSGSGGGGYSGAWRMTYAGTWGSKGKDGWEPAFQYNENPLTKEQQDALDSGITSQKVGKLDALPTAAGLTPVAPSTDASAQGKPADAKATGDALAGKLDKSGGEISGDLVATTVGADAAFVAQSSTTSNAVGMGVGPDALYPMTKVDGYWVYIEDAWLGFDRSTGKWYAPGLADAADLRYRIAEAELTAKLPTGVTVWIGGVEDTEYTIHQVTTTNLYFLIGGDGLEYTCWNANGEFLPEASPQEAVFKDGDVTLQEPPDLIFPRALADRAVNLITATTETSIDIVLPAVQAGHSRDFYLAVTCGSTAPTLNAPTGVTLVNAKGEEPDLTLTPDATTILRFTEVKEADAEADPPESAVFCVTGGANGGGSLDLSVLAGEFSEQVTYEEGDIVQYQGELYMCEFAVDTPGPWDPSDWTSGSPVIPALLSMIRGKADSSALATKAESEALAPAWESGHAYFKGDHVSYHGLLYECLSTVAGSTDPSADTTHWKQTDLAAPDATLDILSDGRLRVVAADGTPMWTQGYALASESAVALSCEKINKYVFAATTATAFSDSSTYAVGDRVVYGGKVYKCSTAVETAGAWTGATNWDEDPDTQAFALPGVPSGVVGDFVLDVDNTANEVPVMVAISGTLGTTYDLIVEKGRSSVDVLTIEGGALAELYFTMTAFGTAAKPAWRVVRLNVERQGVGS